MVNFQNEKKKRYIKNNYNIKSCMTHQQIGYEHGDETHFDSSNHEIPKI